MNDKMKITIEILNTGIEEEILRKGEWEDDSLFGRSLRNALMHFTKEKIVKNDEIENTLKDLSKRVEILEKQMKEDKEEQLKKLQAELEYAKFRCALPTIQHTMGDEEYTEKKGCNTCKHYTLFNPYCDCCFNLNKYERKETNNDHS